MGTERLSEQHSFLSGGGEMSQLMREHDWANTPVGAISTWPQSLRTSVSMCLNSRFPIVLFWGPNFYQFYNDAYSVILGEGKHPQALGQRAQECWAEIWDEIGPMLAEVLAGGEATWSDRRYFLLNRNGYLEECYFTFSYSPILNDVGTVEGVLEVVTETTGEVLGNRRLQLLQALATNTSEARTAEAVYQQTATTLSSDVADLPFALLYQLSTDGRQAHLAGSAGLSMGTRAAPAVVTPGSAEDVWSLAKVMQSGQQLLLANVEERVGELTGYNASRFPPPERALVLPLGKPADAHPYGVLVVGLSPYRLLDKTYESFCDLVARQITTALTSALAYQQERQRAEALAELDRAKTAFFSNVSHEFRTPLTLSLGPLEALLSDDAHPLSQEQRAQLEMVYRNELRQLKLVNTLLDFSRIEAGRAEVASIPTDLAQLTRDLTSIFRSAVERAGLQLVIECPPLPKAVYVDPDMWEKIVLNLLSNALKATFEGKIRVALKWATDFIELVVQDTGVGISQEDLPHIFERFYRVPHARSRTHEGTGIGLALVQELVRLHGGTIAVESSEGVGTNFTIRLPGHGQFPKDFQETSWTRNATELGAAAYMEEALRWLPDTPTATNNHSMTPMDTQMPSPLQGEQQELAYTLSDQQKPGKFHLMSTPASMSFPKREKQPAHVLIADDNADMRDYLNRLLSPYYQVTLVADGTSVLSLTRSILPDLIISDVMMPGLDGLALLKTLRTTPETANISVILLSARAGEEAILAGLQAGANDYLVKPFSSRELLARVETRLAVAQLLEKSQAAGIERGLERDRLYNILAQAPMPLAITRGPEQTFTLFNPLFQRVAGERAILGKTYQEVLPELVGQGLFEIIDRVYQTGEAFFAPEYTVWLANADGKLEERAFNFTYQPLRDLTGKVEGIMQVGFEVTEQVRARRRAQEISRELEATFEAMIDGVIVYDAQGKIVRANRAMREMLALDQVKDYAQLPFASRLLLLDPRDEQGVSMPLEDWPSSRVLRGETLTKNQTVEMQVRALDGRESLLSVTGAPIRDQQEQIVGAVLVLRDVAEQRALQQRSQRSLDALLQIARVLVEVTTDPDELLDEDMWSHISDVMGQLANLTRRVLGCQRLSITTIDEESGLLCPVASVGMDPALIDQWWEETSRTRLQDNFSREQIARLTAGEVLQLSAQNFIEQNPGEQIKEQLERYNIRTLFCAPLRAGTRLFGLLSADHGGGVPHVYTQAELHLAEAIATLITLVLERERLLRERVEARKYEQTLRARHQQLANLIALAHDAIIVRTLQDTIVFWNEGAERLYGWTAEQALGQNVHAFLQTRFPLSLEATMAELRTRGQWEGELEHRRINGDALHVESRQVVAHDEADQPQVILEINRDITARDHLLRERAEAQAREHMAIETARARDEFIGIASHELRTPITSIKGNAQLAARFLKSLELKLSADDPDLRERLDLIKELVSRIERQANLQNRLVGDMVDISRIQARKLVLHLAPVDVVAIVRETVEDQRLATPERTILFETRAQTAMVLADDGRIGQVVGNYLSNALKYSPAERPVLTRLEVDDSQVRVLVQDQGPGLTTEAQAQVWERFYRAPGAEDHSGSGADLGLGLYISRTIIEQHGGRVGIISETGAGATFWFTLPVASSDCQTTQKGLTDAETPANTDREG